MGASRAGEDGAGSWLATAPDPEAKIRKRQEWAHEVRKPQALLSPCWPSIRNHLQNSSEDGVGDLCLAAQDLTSSKGIIRAHLGGRRD